jgi:hypothetical protein
MKARHQNQTGFHPSWLTRMLPVVALAALRSTEAGFPRQEE